jgi:hypothetical protein
MQASFPDVPTESLLALFRPQPHADADTNARELARALVGADPTVRQDVCAMLTWHTGYVSLSLCVCLLGLGWMCMAGGGTACADDAAAGPSAGRVCTAVTIPARCGRGYYLDGRPQHRPCARGTCRGCMLAKD